MKTGNPKKKKRMDAVYSAKPRKAGGRMLRGVRAKKSLVSKKTSGALLYITAFLWMGVIFALSSVQGDGVAYEMPRTLFLERKGAHVFEYFMLTILFFRAFSFHLPFNRTRAVILSVFVSLLYAVSDETHQLFVFGRTGKATDVLIDGLGILIAVFVIVVFTRRRKKS